MFRAYKIAVGCCTPFTSIITVELMAYCVLRLLLNYPTQKCMNLYTYRSISANTCTLLMKEQALLPSSEAKMH